MRKHVLFCLLVASVSIANAQTAAPAEDKEKKAEFINELFSDQSYLSAQIVDKIFTLKLSPTCWTKFNDKSGNPNRTGAGAMRYWTRYVVEYAKREGLGDLMALAVDDKKIEKENRPMIDDMIKEIGQKISLTLEAPMECKGMAYDLMMRYPFETLERVGHSTPFWAPTSGEAHLLYSGAQPQGNRYGRQDQPRWQAIHDHRPGLHGSRGYGRQNRQRTGKG